ncbi:phage holin family protein [Domibacillus sp. 8LH]|uniref:phage holin family protein n=1 Tax=Domibacillus sp. 8LH TaxID=3073900 RepID=UPI0034E07753
MCAWKAGRLHSRTVLYGYARKARVFMVIIAANSADQTFGVDGALAVNSRSSGSAMCNGSFF